MSETNGSARNRLRSTIFSGKSKHRKSKIIDFMGEKVEVRQPTIRQITEMAKAAKQDDVNAILLSIIEHCYVPGTEEQLFEKGDQEGLLDLPAGDWLNNLNKAIEELTGIDVGVAEKNLEKTA